MEKTTSNTFLYYVGITSGTPTGTPAKLCDITSYPAPFVNPEKLDISDLSSNQRKYTQGMKDLPDYEFGFIYTKNQFSTMHSMCTGANEGKVYHFFLCFGTPSVSGTTVTSDYGVFEFDASMSVSPDGGDVGSVRTGTITLYAESDVEFS